MRWGHLSFLSRTSPPDTMGYCSLAVMLLLKGGGGVYLPLFEESTRRPHDGRWSLATADVIKSLKKKSHSHDASAKFASFLLDWWRFHTNNVSFFFLLYLPSHSCPSFLHIHLFSCWKNTFKGWEGRKWAFTASAINHYLFYRRSGTTGKLKKWETWIHPATRVVLKEGAKFITFYIL